MHLDCSNCGARHQECARDEIKKGHPLLFIVIVILSTFFSDFIRNNLIDIFGTFTGKTISVLIFIVIFSYGYYKWIPKYGEAKYIIIERIESPATREDAIIIASILLVFFISAIVLWQFVPMAPK